MRPSTCSASLALVLAALGCSSADTPPVVPDDHGDPAAVSLRLGATLDALAAMGEKRAGTAPATQAGDYLAQRFGAAGLADVHFESFDFLQFQVESSSIALTVDGAALPMAHDVFAYSGAGEASGELCDVGLGHEEDYEGKDAAGKIVLVTRDPSFHRSSQYREAVAHDGAAMLYISQSPDNLVQIGTVADPEDGPGPIPTVTVGADDGAAIQEALAGGKLVEATIAVDATVEPATGRNVIGRLPGTSAGGEYLLIGAHYDTWYAGAADNGTGVAALLETMEALALQPERTFTIVFVAYDGEELGLFGGYDYLRDHLIVGGEKMLAFVNFEMPAAGDDGELRGMAHTNDSPVLPVLEEVALPDLYTTTVGMEVVPGFFGGIIPTDIQGMYWTGHQGVTTACNSLYYHTPEDTPDKIDVGFLADAVIAFERAALLWDQREADAFSEHDHTLWRIETTTSEETDGLRVDVTARDAAGVAQAEAAVRVWLDVDDFTRVHDERVTTDRSGTASVLVPASALAMGSGARWVHVTAGVDYPLAEQIIAVE